MGRGAWRLTRWSALGLVALLGGLVHALGLSPTFPVVDLTGSSNLMAKGLGKLAEDVRDAGSEGPGTDLSADCRELASALEGWSSLAGTTADLDRSRRSYASLDLSWHRVRDRIPASPVTAADAREVDRADAAIHAALGLKAVPTHLEGVGSAPTGLAEVGRLAYAMSLRSEAIGWTIRAIPNRALTGDFAEVVRRSGGFSDLFNSPGGSPELEPALKAFVPLFQGSIRLGMAIERVQASPDLRSAWLDYAATLMLTRDALKAASGRLKPLPTSPDQPSPPVALPFAIWAKALESEIDELKNGAGRAEPLGDLERLRADLRSFQDEAALWPDVARLAFRFRFVDEDWRRWLRRSNRGPGPKSAQFQRIGAALAPIHANLGMPSPSPLIESN